MPLLPTLCFCEFMSTQKHPWNPSHTNGKAYQLSVKSWKSNTSSKVFHGKPYSVRSGNFI